MEFTEPEPLRGKHDLGSFCCGDDALDGWLHRYARHAEAARSAKVFVSTADGVRVTGFHALTAGQVAPAQATARLQSGQPSGRPVPVALLSRLAVDQRYQGRGLGAGLLRDAILRVSGAAEQIGIRAIAVHAASEEARGFYSRFGFEPSPTDPMHLVLLIKDFVALLKETEG